MKAMAACIMIAPASYRLQVNPGRVVLEKVPPEQQRHIPYRRPGPQHVLCAEGHRHHGGVAEERPRPCRRDRCRSRCGLLFFGLTGTQWALVILAMTAVWTAEAFNTGCELLADAISPEFHPLVGKAKDVAAGAVLIAAVGAVVIGVLVFVPRVLDTWVR